MPVRQTPLHRRILAHGGNNNAVIEGKRAETGGGEELGHGEAAGGIGVGDLVGGWGGVGKGGVSALTSHSSIV